MTNYSMSVDSISHLPPTKTVDALRAIIDQEVAAQTATMQHDIDYLKDAVVALTGGIHTAPTTGTTTTNPPNTVTIGANSFPLGGIDAAKVVNGMTQYTPAYGPTIPAPANSLAGVMQIEITVVNGAITSYYDRAASAGSGGAGPGGRSLTPTAIPSNGYVLVGDQVGTSGVDDNLGGQWLNDYAQGSGKTVALSYVAAGGGGTVSTATGVWWSGQGDTTTTKSGSFAAWRGRPVEIATNWAGTASAAVQIGSSGYDLPVGQAYGSMIRVDFATGGPLAVAGHSWALAATGGMDSHWTSLIQTLKTNWGARRPEDMYIRLAHEFNGNWYDWCIDDGQQGNFIAGWRRFWTLLQTYMPGAKLVWCVNAGTRPRQGHPTYNVLTTCWPGDGYVDVVSVDTYNRDPWVNDQASFNAKWSSSEGLETYRLFALAHGKPLAISEWSNAAVDTGGGGGDAPSFFQYFHDWLVKNSGPAAGQVLYESLFNVTGYNDHYEMYPVNSMPQSAAKYQQLW